MTELEYVRSAGNSIYYGFETASMTIVFILLLKVILTKNKIKYYEIYAKFLLCSLLLINVHLIRISKLYNVYEHLDNVILVAFYATFSYTIYNMFKYYCNIIHLEDINNIKMKLIFCAPFVISIRYLFTDEQNLKACFTIFFMGIITTLSFYMIFYCMIVNKSYSDRLKLVIPPLVPIILVYLHVENPCVPLGIGIALCALIGYINSVDLLISIDWLTNTNNRSNLHNYIDYKLKKNTSDLHILMIDADEFKKINDMHGHVEGDMCLIRIANAIKLACNKLSKRAFICRYGGDEFIVVSDAPLNEVSNLQYSILEELEKMNDISSCKVNVSIGIYTHKTTDENISVNELIFKADVNLYEKKGKNKRKKK